MHDIVQYTRGLLRDDKPIHLLGIGGVRDIFHGVRQGIDTFDCVHPTRLGRHGGALVTAAYWDEEPNSEPSPSIAAAHAARLAKKEVKEETRRAEKVSSWRQAAELSGQDPDDFVRTCMEREQQETTRRQQQPEESSFPKSSSFLGGKLPSQQHQRQRPRVIREHMNVTKAPMRHDPRPIDSSCSCYTCRNFSRAYLHHLFKAGESLGGTLVTIHNAHFMTRLMRDIRRAIAFECGVGVESGAGGATLAEVEAMYVHPSIGGTEGLAASDSIGA
jgi:hypothetical protein